MKVTSTISPVGDSFWLGFAKELYRSFVCDTCGRGGGDNCSLRTLPQKKGVNCWRPKGCLLVWDEERI
jgi:hypothetical protein